VRRDPQPSIITRLGRTPEGSTTTDCRDTSHNHCSRSRSNVAILSEGFSHSCETQPVLHLLPHQKWLQQHGGRSSNWFAVVVLFGLERRCRTVESRVINNPGFPRKLPPLWHAICVKPLKSADATRFMPKCQGNRMGDCQNEDLRVQFGHRLSANLSTLSFTERTVRLAPEQMRICPTQHCR
jgi:hypothetical protein